MLINWVLVAAVLFLSLTPSPPEILDFAFSDKFEHLFAYSVLMGWAGQLYVSTHQQITWARWTLRDGGCSGIRAGLGRIPII